MIADPFPHLVIEDFLPRKALEWSLEYWPTTGWTPKFGPKCDGKYAKNTDLGVHMTAVLDMLADPFHMTLLRAKTGIDGLIADPSLEGGGLHQTEPGGYLGIHTDFNKLGTLDRRLNLLVFLNNWMPGDGGELELWNEQECVRVIEPAMNRAVLFETSERSWHGHPNPTRTLRRSIAMYYYTQGDDSPAHGTIYR